MVGWAGLGWAMCFPTFSASELYYPAVKGSEAEMALRDNFVLHNRFPCLVAIKVLLV